MQAGRELDALIAEKMGWIDLEELSIAEGDSRDDWIGIPPGHEGVSRMGASPFQEVPCYSTDITAAWLVVDALAARNYLLTLDMRGGDPWWAEFATLDYESGGQAAAATAPLAICLAALEAR